MPYDVLEIQVVKVLIQEMIYRYVIYASSTLKHTITTDLLNIVKKMHYPIKKFKNITLKKKKNIKMKRVKQFMKTFKTLHASRKEQH